MSEKWIVKILMHPLPDYESHHDSRGEAIADSLGYIATVQRYNAGQSYDFIFDESEYDNIHITMIPYEKSLEDGNKTRHIFINKITGDK